MFTPLINQYEIDYKKIEEFVSRQYQRAAIKKQDIQMGAIIITGETARKENAEKVLKSLSHYAGDFVVAAAGPDLEGVIAARGAGTSRYSKEKQAPVINLDIGGGTTNLAAFDGDQVLDTACFDVGGRLIRLDPATKEVTYLAPKIKQLISRLSLNIHEGKTIAARQLNPVIDTLVRILENSIGLGERDAFFDLFVTNHSFSKLDPTQIKTVTFSGGVADCLWNEPQDSPFKYGDIGVLLGRKLRQSLIFNQRNVLHSKETIRATVVGAGSHTIDVSGSTVSYTPGVLPLRNIPILNISVKKENLDSLADTIENQLNWFRVNMELSNAAISLTGLKSPTFEELQSCAKGIIKGANGLIERRLPLIVVTYEDIAKALGHSLSAYLPPNYPFVCIDRVKVEHGDYIDLGEPVAHATVIPVSVKTLLFN